MHTRTLTPLVLERLKRFPAVALVGPRQCGKTTLARSIGSAYFNLEAPEERTRLDARWDEILSGPGPVVLDEAQCWPEVFARLRGAIDDARRRNGRFLLLGSVSPALMREVSESLAGRMAVVELTPFHAGEVKTLDPLWRFGGFPDGGVLEAEAYPVWQENYLRAMAERDLPVWGLSARAVVTQRLFRMLAAEHGAILNLSKLGQSLGHSYHTVATYLDHLEAAYLIRRLPPFHANLRKRLVKAPRVYWRDSGLLHALLRLAPGEDPLGLPWAGASWEGFVIEQILADRSARGESCEACFFRSHDGFEVDLVLDYGREREAIEIKLTSSPAPSDLHRLDAVAKLIGATRQTLLCRIRKPIESGSLRVTNLARYLAG